MVMESISDREQIKGDKLGCDAALLQLKFYLCTHVSNESSGLARKLKRIR